jgi:hypothetical protein
MSGSTPCAGVVAEIPNKPAPAPFWFVLVAVLKSPRPDRTDGVGTASASAKRDLTRFTLSAVAASLRLISAFVGTGTRRAEGELILSANVSPAARRFASRARSVSANSRNFLMGKSRFRPPSHKTVT